jgi:NDP-sugar pyrophosphorylase family protein
MRIRGAHCKIGAQAKIVNSVVLDHVTIEEGAVLHNCVVANSWYQYKTACCAHINLV